MGQREREVGRRTQVRIETQRESERGGRERGRDGGCERGGVKGWAYFQRRALFVGSFGRRPPIPPLLARLLDSPSDAAKGRRKERLPPCPT